MTPHESVFKVATSMFRDLWDRQLGQARERAKAMAAELVRIEKETAKFLDRIHDT